MADEVNAGGNPGAEGAAPNGDAAATSSAPASGAGAAPAGGDAVTPPAGDAAPKNDKAAAPPADDKAKAGDDKAGEPIDYGKVLAEVKLPEGMTLDEATAKVATELFGKHSLSPETVKELTEFYVSQQQAAAQQSIKAWNDLQEKWKAEATADKDITPELKAEAKTVFGVLSKESRELLEGYGLTNFGPLLKDLARFHDFVGDDSFARGGASASRNGDARGFFPNSNMNP